MEGSGAAATTTPALTSSATSTAAVNTAQTSATAGNLPPSVTAATTASKSGANGMRAEGFASTVLSMILFLTFASGFMVAFV